jgi:hypothetical protein
LSNSKNENNLPEKNQPSLTDDGNLAFKSFVVVELKVKIRQL